MKFGELECVFEDLLEFLSTKTNLCNCRLNKLIDISVELSTSVKSN